MSIQTSVGGVLDQIPRVRFATLPTVLEPGVGLPNGARLWVKRDDLTGLGMGGNKARKLEFLCGEATATGARTLITVGAAQSNHCRMTAAAGAILGLDVHLVLAGDRPASATGNQLLAELFGAQLHFTGAEESHWGELEIARESLHDELTADGAAPYSIPIGGSTALGALGYVDAYFELDAQLAAAAITPAAIVVTSSSGGTHAGLLAGRALATADGAAAPDIIAIGVAKGVNQGMPDVVALANDALRLLDFAQSVTVSDRDFHVETDYLGTDYAVPTDAGDAAIRWAATNGGWLLDRTYSGKGMSGLLGLAEAGRWGANDEVVFIHTGGIPALFAAGGAPNL